jgi:hypothetical protein
MAKRKTEDDSYSNGKNSSARTGGNFDSPKANAGPGGAALLPDDAVEPPDQHNADRGVAGLSKDVLHDKLKTLRDNAIEAMSTLDPEEQDTSDLVQWSKAVTLSLGHYGHYLLPSPPTDDVDQDAAAPPAAPVAPPAPAAVSGFTFGSAAPPAATAPAATERSAAASQQNSLFASVPARDSAESNDEAVDPAGDQDDSNEGILRAAEDPNWETKCSVGPVKVFHLNDPKQVKSGWKQLGGKGFLHLQLGKGAATLDKKRILFRDGSLGAPPLNMMIDSKKKFSLAEKTSKDGKESGILGLFGVNDQARGYEMFNVKANISTGRELLAELQSFTA